MQATSKSETLRKLFTPMSDEEAKEQCDEVKKADGNGGGQGSGLDDEFTRGGDGGRSEFWYQNMEDQVQENTQMTAENKERTVRIDERTAWMAKILFAILLAFLVSVGAGMTLQLLF